MGIFSLNWFRSEKQKELEALKVEGQKLKNELLSKELTQNKEEKPYKNVKLVDSVLIITLKDGSVLSKTGASIKDFQAVKDSTEEYQLFKIATNTEGDEERRKFEKEAAKNQILSKGLEALKELDDFKVVDGAVYLKIAPNRSLPQLLVEKFAEFVSVFEGGDNWQEAIKKDINYQGLKKFWLKCCLNPNAQSAEDLYDFLTHHQFKIDNHGNFYAYRRVQSKGIENKKLIDFISNSYNKVKAVWKKKPSNFEVYSRLGDFKLIDLNKGNIPSDENPYWDYVGSLQELYLDLPNMKENSYTSAHTGKEDYRVGEIVSMPRDDGDDNNGVSCSKGFHAASKKYDYSGFGDVPILVIINPMDVLAVPVGEVGKLRTCRWFFAMTLDESEQFILDEEDFDVSELGDVFEEKCMENLQDYVKNSFAEEVKRHTFTLPSISGTEVNTIIRSLEDMRNEISNRVSEVY